MISLSRRRPVIVSAIAAIMAMIVSASYLKSREHKLLRMSELIYVVRAKSNIRAGDLMRDESLSVDKVPRHFAQPGHYLSAKEVRGRIAAVDITAESQITTSHLRGMNLPGGVAALIPTDQRTLTLTFDDPSGGFGIIKPGDRVDLLATFDLGREAASRRTTLVLAEGVAVLAVKGKVYDASIEMAKTSANNSLFGGGFKSPYKKLETVLTLAAAQETIQKIVFARNYGSLSIALCPFDYKGDVVRAAPVTISTITGKYDNLLPLKKGFREYKGR